MFFYMRQRRWYDRTTQHYTQNFPIFSSLCNQIENFIYHWKRKLEDYKCSLSTKSKGIKKKTQEKKEGDYDSFLSQSFWKKRLSKPSLVSNPISSSSFNQFEQVLCHWKLKLEEYKCAQSTKSKGARKKMQEEKEEDCDILFQIFGKKTLDFFYFQTPYFPHI